MPIRRTLNNVDFEFGSHGLEAWGYVFDPSPSFTIKRPLEFWRVQLAFRGFSPKGKDIETLKARFRSIEEKGMDNDVARFRDEMAELVSGSKKRKADEQAAPPRPAPAARPQVDDTPDFVAARGARTRTHLIQARPLGYVVRKQFAEDEIERFFGKLSAMKTDMMVDIRLLNWPM